MRSAISNSNDDTARYENYLNLGLVVIKQTFGLKYEPYPDEIILKGTRIDIPEGESHGDHRRVR